MIVKKKTVNLNTKFVKTIKIESKSEAILRTVSCFSSPSY